MKQLNREFPRTCYCTCGDKNIKAGLIRELKIKRADRFRPGFVSLLVNLHRNRENIRTRIGHDIRVTHHVYQVFEIPFGNV